MIVTGADRTHCRSLFQFLGSLSAVEDAPVVVFDLGLRASERSKLERRFPDAEVRTFDYSTYPDYFDIRVDAGQYAWKPVIVNRVLHEFKRPVCWMDAGNVVSEPLIDLRSALTLAGMYSPLGRGTVREWTHPKTIEFLGVNDSDSILDDRNLSGYCVGVNYECEPAVEVVREWAKCALTKECIAPEGSDRSNHRQDQSVLTILARRSGIADKMPRSLLGFQVQQDVEERPAAVPP
jgi:uncharacterized protein DUF1647